MFLEGAVVWAVARRRLVRRFPVFFLYVAFHLLRELLEFSAWHISLRSHFRVYWTGEVIGFTLAYLLIFDFWKQGLRPYIGIWRASRWVLGLTCLALFGLVSGTTGFGQGADAQAGHYFTYWMLLLNRTVLLTQASFMMAFFLVMGFFRVRVPVLVHNLALCWFAYNILTLALYSLEYFFGPAVQTAYSLALSLSFIALLGSWLAAVWNGSHEEAVAPAFKWRTGQRQELVRQMEVLNSSLLRLWKA